MIASSNNKSLIRITLLLSILLIFSISVQAEPGKEKNGSDIHTGKLLQMFKSGGYTYLEYESDGNKHWAATKMIVANIGNEIEFKKPILMKDFYSKTLKRKFDWIYFAGFVRAVGKSGDLPVSPMPSMMGHKKMNTDKKVITVKPGSVKKADKGVTISECFENKKDLEGKVILLRAVVVKVSMKIKGRNWVHIRDGSGKSGSNDITFTTKEILVPGDLVLIKGKLILNKDIGSGYKFPVFIEDPEITKEK